MRYIVAILSASAMLCGCGHAVAASDGSDPQAERLWNRCVQTMRKIKTLDASYVLTTTHDPIDSTEGTIHFERSGRMRWSRSFVRDRSVVRIVMESDGERATITNSQDARPEHMAHEEFCRLWKKAWPVGAVFYEPDGLTRYRPAGAPIRSAGTKRVGKTLCHVLRIIDHRRDMVTEGRLDENGNYIETRRPRRHTTTDLYIDPHGVYRGRRITTEGYQPTELRLLTASVTR